MLLPEELGSRWSLTLDEGATRALKYAAHAQVDLYANGLALSEAALDSGRPAYGITQDYDGVLNAEDWVKLYDARAQEFREKRWGETEGFSL